MQKEFLKHSLVYTLAVLFNRGVAFFLLPLMTHYLSPADYGTIDFINLTATFLITLCGLELHQGLARFMSDIPHEEDKKLMFSSTIWFVVFSYAVWAILANIFNSHAVNLIIPLSSRWLFNLALLNFVLQGLIYYFSILLRFNLKPRLNIYLNSFTGLMILGFTALFVAYLHKGVSGAIYALVLGNLCGTVLGWFFIRDYLVFKFNHKLILNLLRFSIPLVFSSLSIYIMLYSDRIMLRELLSLDEVGIFGVGYRLASIISILMVGVSSSIGPLIYNSMNNEHFKTELARLSEKFLYAGLLVLLFIKVFADLVLHLVVSSAFYSASVTLVHMSIAIFASQLVVFLPGLTINKKTGTIMLLSMFGATLNLGLCWVLIRWFGLNGASSASMISYLVYFIAYFSASQIEAKLPYDYHKIAIAIGSITMMFIVDSLISNIYPAKYVIFAIFSLMYIAFIFFQKDDSDNAEDIQ